MKWEPTDCKTGDMVRIRLGSIYHYGVFLSEDEVVQFGYPPIPEFSEQNAVVTLFLRSYRRGRGARPQGKEKAPASGKDR